MGRVSFQIFTKALFRMKISVISSVLMTRKVQTFFSVVIPVETIVFSSAFEWGVSYL
jgi:hypothetical protein